MLSYQNEGFSLNMTGRGFTGGLYALGAIECSANCPTSTVIAPTYDRASLPGAFYLDGSVSDAFRKSE